jgi:uncharacterized protein YecE (DUF72 family)
MKIPDLHPLIHWYIGCSGFHYKEWKNIFYPKGVGESKWFEFYCRHFNTLELNVTFYRFPQLSMLESWYRRSPDDFMFAVKVPRTITHIKQFNDAHAELNDFYNLLRFGLKEKLGCVLFQLPPKYHYSEENLEKILNHVHPAFTNVVEFRHESWWREDVKEKLWLHHVIFCGVSYPGLPDEVMTKDVVSYYRFHGVPKLYYSPYEESFLEKVVKEINGSEKVSKAFLFFNNTATNAALSNARFVQGLTGSNPLNTEAQNYEFDF